MSVLKNYSVSFVKVKVIKQILLTSQYLTLVFWCAHTTFDNFWEALDFNMLPISKSGVDFFFPSIWLGFYALNQAMIHLHLKEAETI